MLVHSVNEVIGIRLVLSHPKEINMLFKHNIAMRSLFHKLAEQNNLDRQ